MIERLANAILEQFYRLNAMTTIGVGEPIEPLDYLDAVVVAEVLMAAGFIRLE